MKKMKNKSSVLKIMVNILFIAMFATLFNVKVEASSFSVSGPSSVEANETFTVNFGSGTTGVYTYSVSGGTIVSSPSWVEGGGSLSVKAGESGNVSVTVTASNVTTSDYEDLAAGTSKSVSVSVKSATPTVDTSADTSASTSTNTSASTNTSTSTNTNSTTTSQPTTTTVVKEPVEVKSNINTLSKLSVEGGNLAPEFSASVTEYELKVLDIDKIKISATAKDSKASVSGTGEKELVLGENEFEIKVTAEDGSTKKYSILVTLELSPTVFIKFGEQELGVVQDLSSVKGLTSFDKCVTEYKGETIEGWYSSELDLTILYMIDEEDVCNFYVYQDETIISLIKKVKIAGTNFFVLESGSDKEEREGMSVCEVDIDEVMYTGWSFDEEVFQNYYIIELMNMEGELVDYLYSVVDGTLIVNPGFATVSYESYKDALEKLENELNESNEDNARIVDKNKLLVMAVGTLSGVLVIMILVIIFKVVKSRKNKTDGEEFEILDLE